MSPFCFVVVNECDPASSPLAAQITQAFLARAASAFQTQLRDHVAPHWPLAAGATFRVGTGASDVGTGEIPDAIVANDPSAPGAMAYHYDTPDGVPDAYSMVDTMSGLGDLTEAMSHEHAEIVGDPNCDQYATVPKGIPLPSGIRAGMQVAREIGDPLQDRSYPIDLGDGLPPIVVSDFALPAYFDVELAGPTSYGEAMGWSPRVLPFGRTPGGYQIARNADGSGETQVFGCVPDWKLARARRGRGRWARRGLIVRPSGRHLGHGAVVVSMAAIRALRGAT